MRIYKCDHRGERRVGYEGELIANDGTCITLRAPWTLPARALPFVTLEPGDVFIETFYTDRWYNVFEIHGPDGALKGWYADICRPARLEGDALSWDDLALDIWMDPDGTMQILDQEEFAQVLCELPPTEAASARGAVPALQDALKAHWRRFANAQIAQALTARGWLLATAESCTGGLISHLLTERPGSSAYFAGGVISYSNAVKQQALGVREETLRVHGAVSAECALEMARGVRRTLDVQVGLSATGIAGPDGATATKPVGLVYIGLSSPLGEAAAQHRWPHDRSGNKWATADAALSLLLQHLRFGQNLA
jgi:nicotinamide-nucleotide amidase